MRRVMNLSKGLAISGLVVLATFGVLWAFREDSVAVLLLLGFVFVVFLAFQVLLFKWMFGGIPYLLMLHPYIQLGLVPAGLPLYIYLSPALWMIGEFVRWIKPSVFMPVSFWTALLLYVVGLTVGMFISYKVLRYRPKIEAKEAEEGEWIPEEIRKKREESRKKQEERVREWRKEILEIARFFEDFRSELLSNRVVGQDYALEEVAKALRTSAKLLGLREEGDELVVKTPRRFHILSSMIFVGATGVGKTETAKALADLLEPYGYQFIRIDLNMYRDEQAVWTLLGSPRGYVGSDRGGELTGKLRKNPRAVILFDEMEKAHPDLHTAFMTLLDEGYVEDRSFGDKLYLELGIVIFTSNLYAREIARLAQSKENNPLELEVELREFVERYFGRAEIVGRIDRIVPFKNLDKGDLIKIAERTIQGYDPSLVHYAPLLVQALSGITERYGVRAMVRKIEEVVVEGEPAVKKLLESAPVKKRDKKVRDWLLDIDKEEV